MLRVDRIKKNTKVLGPGQRLAIWFHGCHRNCPGCVAIEMNRSTDYQVYTPNQLIECACSVSEIEGITISGGEPFDQSAEELEIFLSGVTKHGLSVMAYTGYDWAALAEDPVRRSLLAYLDILVDGPYQETEDHGELWRGSANQQIHFLSPRYRDLETFVQTQKGRPLEIELEGPHNFSFAGIPPRNFREKLKSSFAEKGLEVNW